jgi:hypothetical protein
LTANRYDRLHTDSLGEEWGDGWGIAAGAPFGL